jgi:DNA replication protein DnaC
MQDKNTYPTEAQIHEKQQLLLGRRFVAKSLSELRTPEWAQVKISNFMKKPTNFLVYCGNPGLGKTHLISGMFEWIMKNYGQNWRYWKEDRLLENLRSSMDSMKGDYLQHLKYMIDAEFLILDDVGSSKKKTDWREEVLFDLIDTRYNSMQPTIITSNFSEQEFKEFYHPRIHSRLFSKENTIIEILDGIDFRLVEIEETTKEMQKKEFEKKD